MRDNHEGMVEFVEAFEKEGSHFVIVEKDSRRFQFGVSKQGYRAIGKAMQLRPFDMMPGLQYQYFNVGSQRAEIGKENYWMEVRIELESDATKERIEIPKDLHANLLWFNRLENIDDAAYLELNKK
jgi:hypothetical protein